MDSFGIPPKNLKELIKLFKDEPSIKDIVLFGSRAMGNYREGSDIDICIHGNADDQKKLKILNRYDSLYLPWKLDLVIWNEVENEDLKEHIKRVGISLKNLC